MTITEYILEFTDADSIYQHLIEIGYELDSLTAAYIVWQSRNHALDEKEKSYKFIIAYLPDMPIPTHKYHFEMKSVHAFLREYMDTLSKYVKRFQEDDENAVYDFSTYYKGQKSAWVDDDNLYSSYEKVFDAACHSFPEKDDDYPKAPRPSLFKIRKRALDVEAGSDYLYLTPNLAPYKLCMDTIMPDEDYEVLHFFENLFPNFPPPSSAYREHSKNSLTDCNPMGN